MYSRALLTGLILFTVMVFFSCVSKKDDGHGHEHHASEAENEWVEMDDFHMIMAETFHPFRDSANLEPARELAGELMMAADEWASSALPGKADNAAMKAKLARLQAEAETLAESVKSPDDKMVGEQLTKLHDTFHEILEAWYGKH